MKNSEINNTNNTGIAYGKWELADGANWWQRLLFRIFMALEPPEGTDRCPWTVPLSDARCLRKVGHRGRCETGLLINGYRTIDSWYGINYKVEIENE